MSKIALSGNASGTGTLTIAAPNTNSNYTLTLPAETGTVTTSGSTPTFTGAVTAPSFIPNGSSVPSNGTFLPAANTLAWSTNTTERARITSGGYFKASNSGSYYGSTNSYHELYSTTTNENVTVFTHTAASPYGPWIRFSGATPNNTTNYFLYCQDSTNAKCIIYSDGTIQNRTGTYTTISDLKLKQDVVDASSQWDDIKALRIVKYRLKDEVAVDPNYPAHIGVIAQEVEQVSPGLVDNCADKDTGEITKSVKSSILYMKAVKALQEAMTRIEALEAQNAAFEARLAALEAK